HRGADSVIAVVPRWPARLAPAHEWPLAAAWGDTMIEVGDGALRSELDGTPLVPERGRLRLADVLSVLPVAQLESGDRGARPRVDGDDSAGPRLPRHIAKAGCAHPLRQLRRLGKLQHARGEVAVGRAVARDHAADPRQDVSEVEQVDAAEWLPRRCREFEDHELGTRPQYAHQLAQPRIEVGEVADPEADGRAIHGGVAQR